MWQVIYYCLHAVQTATHAVRLFLVANYAVGHEWSSGDTATRILKLGTRSPHRPGRCICEERVLVSTGEDSGRYPEPVWMLWRSDMSCYLHQQRNPDFSVFQSIIWLQYPPRHGGSYVKISVEYKYYFTQPLHSYSFLLLCPSSYPPPPQKSGIYIWTNW
jgi:hypothetical protein